MSAPQPRDAGDITDGWIRLPHPVAPRAWFAVVGVTAVGGWVTFRLAGRADPYSTTAGHTLQWSRTQPG